MAGRNDYDDTPEELAIAGMRLGVELGKRQPNRKAQRAIIGGAVGGIEGGKGKATKSDVLRGA